MSKNLDHLTVRILKYFDERRGQRLINKTVAQALGMHTRELRYALQKMVKLKQLQYEHHTGYYGGYYFLPNEHDTRRPEVAVVRKEFRYGKEWDTVFERIAEYRAIKSLL